MKIFYMIDFNVDKIPKFPSSSALESIFSRYLFCLPPVTISRLTCLRENNLAASLQKCFLILVTPFADCPFETLRKGDPGEGRKPELRNSLKSDHEGTSE